MEIRKQCQLGVKITRCTSAIDSLSHPLDQAVQNANQDNIFFCSIKRRCPIYSANQNDKIENDYDDCVCYKQEGRGFNSR
jgi:hypothetical protein